MKFILKAIDDFGGCIIKEFTYDVWQNTLPDYLDFLRGAGFVINNDISLYPESSDEVNAKRIGDEEVMDAVLNALDKEQKKDEEKHSKYWYDKDRNKA